MDERIYMFTFKYIENLWYGFDSNMAKVQGPYQSFNDVFAEVLGADSAINTKTEQDLWKEGTLFAIQNTATSKEAKRLIKAVNIYANYIDRYVDDWNNGKYYIDHYDGFTFDTKNEYFALEIEIVWIALMIGLICFGMACIMGIIYGKYHRKGDYK